MVCRAGHVAGLERGVLYQLSAPAATSDVHADRKSFERWEKGLQPALPASGAAGTWLAGFLSLALAGTRLINRNCADGYCFDLLPLGRSCGWRVSG